MEKTIYPNKRIITPNKRYRRITSKGRTYKSTKPLRLLCFTVSVSIISPLFPTSDYQNFLHDKIKELHDSGLGYRRIAYWLNDNQYKTPRGHEFKNNHVHSILKKRRIRNERINRPYELTFGEWFVKDIKDSD